MGREGIGLECEYSDDFLLFGLMCREWVIGMTGDIS